jgi:LAO/AO transport system kinase
MLDLSGHVDWRPPIVETVAANGSGIAELWAQVAAHRAHLVDAGLLASRRAGRLEAELRRILLAELAARVADVASGPVFAEAMAAVVEGGLDPYRAADRVLAAHPGPGPDATAAPERRVRFAGG